MEDGVWTVLIGRAIRWRSGRKESNEETASGPSEAEWWSVGSEPAFPMQSAADVGRKSRGGEGIRPTCRHQITEAERVRGTAWSTRGGHHVVDAEGMAGLQLRAVDGGLVDEFVGAGAADPDAMDDED